jgi:hypothetical protein
MRTSSRIALITPLLLMTAACGGGRDGGDTTTFGNDGVSSFGNDDGIETGGNDGSHNDDGTIKLDSNDEDDDSRSSASDGGGAKGCQAIDFLFVIDNSGSMSSNQTNLINSFPGFIATIQEKIQEVDSYHIMVVKTDEMWNTCTVECAFFPSLCQHGGVNGCNGAPTVCDNTMGAGVNFPFGSNASNQYCDLTGGQRYITPQEPFDLLPSRFTCIAKVGTSGSGAERQIEALTTAVAPAINGPGGCNSGFLRDDAILVVTIITDEEDDNSAGNPDSWYESVVAQKGGNPDAIVMLGLINDTNADPQLCPAGSDDPVKIRTFLEMFPHSFEGSVCADNFAPFFEQAVDLIDTTCDEFEPIG